jgi:uncharacterized DUF497 family protein
LYVCTDVHILPFVEYEWDARKARSNLQKHGIDFADAVSVLEDELALTIPDDEAAERRFATIGEDSLRRILVVVFTERADRIRIISARKATRNERQQYEG